MIKYLKCRDDKNSKNIKYFQAKYNKKRYPNLDLQNQKLFNSKNVGPK